MTQTPDEVLLAPNGGLPTANYPKAELVKFIRATPAREAADDMLAALWGFDPCVIGHGPSMSQAAFDEAWANARAVIAEATGETH